MPELLEFRYPSARSGHTIYAQELCPDTPPRAVIQIVHGVAEHMGRYEEVSQFLAAHGFLVCGEDHLGHGKTVEDGSYGFFAPKGGWDLVVRDVRRLRELEGDGLVVRREYLEVPVRVEYAITEPSRRLIPILDALGDWSLTLRRPGQVTAL